MNKVLELRGNRFVQQSRSYRGGGISMKSDEVITVEKVRKLIFQLEGIVNFWNTEDKPFSGILLSVYYNKIVAKSNRISELLKGEHSNSCIVGAKFNNDKNRHIITYYLEMNDLKESISLLKSTITVLQNKFNGTLTKEIFEDKELINSEEFSNCCLSQTRFKKIISDLSYIEDFGIETGQKQTQDSIVTLYNTDTETKLILKNLGINVYESRILDENTVFLDEDQLERLYDRAPYLVSMATVDISKLSTDDFSVLADRAIIAIPNPTVEPTIGVIDTLFDEDVYFSEWVEYHDMVDSNIPRSSKDYNHGTAVSSLIVDGHSLNPWLDDGCGRFKVRHFGVATGSSFSSFTITKKIREIVLANKDIKVWNISLGSNKEISDNFISAEAAVLDRIQYENDVIFVVAGTNKPDDSVVKIGSPADSINSMVVNSVSKSNKFTSYTREGIVLSFFSKPDVSYYGGCSEEYIRVCEPLGEAKVSGTSYAAPWIARKLAYLIHVLGINRELAKALIIDSARDWNDKPSADEIALYGHGIVPISINDIVHTKKNEIRFLVSDISEMWNTFNYNFPIPLQNNMYPYIARATMCYFPKCDRSQGVDYTNTELNLKFGRIRDDGTFNDIKNDYQNEDNIVESKRYLQENDARLLFRKWDNVKYVAEIPSTRKRPKISYENKKWGMSIKTNNRLNSSDGIDVRFGVVVTIKEINGINRIDEFIRNCHLNGWIVNELDIESRINIAHNLEEEIDFE